MMSDRELTIPKNTIEKTEETNQVVENKEEVKQEVLTKEESEYMEKVFFEDDEVVRLRDGKSYRIPPLALKDALRLMKRLNSIDTGVIIANLIDDGNGNNNYDDLLEVLLMAFKPYYKDITVDYLAEYVDLHTAKKIIDIMIGLNGLKKSL
jgi:hypothetical protein